MKQFNISLLLIILMSMVGATASAHDIEVANADGQIIYYVWDSDYTELSVSFKGQYYYSYSNEYSGNIVIPESVIYNGKSYSVASIGKSAFEDCSGLTSVTIPNSVKSIDSSAFESCSGLTSVTIPNSVTSIGYGAFERCSGLTSVTIPNSVTSIGMKAFEYCSGLTSVTIPSSVTDIGNWAFEDCSGLTSIIVEDGNSTYDSRDNCNAIIKTASNTLIQGCSTTVIPNSVTSIGSSAFSYCSGLTSITIPNSVTAIHYDAFLYCSGLTSVTIGNNVTSIGDYAFYGCSGLTSITIPNSVEYIYSSAFSYCSGLTSITIPNSVTAIGSAAFWDCSSLTSVTIPSSVTSIGGGVFGGCSGLTSIIVEDGNSIYDSRDNCNAIIETATNKLIQGCSTTVIPNSVTSIGDYAFQKCSGITSVTIPNSVTSIGEQAFYNTNLNSVTIGSGVLSIGSDAFSVRNKPVKVIWLPNTPPSGYENVGGTVNYVVSDLYEGLNNSKVYPFLSYVFEVDGVKYVPVNASERTCDAIDCAYDERTTNIHIGKTVSYRGISFAVKEVSPYICYENLYIKDVDLELEGNVGDWAFYCCSGLTSVTIGNSVASIGKSAFEDCSSLTSVTIPNSVTSIGDYAFQKCSGLASVTIGNSVASIGKSAFEDCYSLTSVTIPNSVTSIGDYAFSGCDGIASVTIGNSVTSIGNNSFEYCSSLTSVTIPNSVTSIGEKAFYNTYLKSVVIGSGVSSIGSDAFSGENMPVKVIWLANTPPSGYENAGGYVNYVVSDNYKGLDNSKVYPLLSSFFEVDGIKYVPVSSSERTCDAIDCAYDESTPSIHIGKTVSYRGISFAVENVNPYICYQYSYINGAKLEVDGDVGDYAFYGCTNLTTAQLDIMGAIGNNTFQSCVALQKVTLGIGITAIGEYAFDACSSLPSITIPQSTTSIGNFAFQGCGALKTVVLKDRADEAILTLGSNGSSPLFADCPLDSVFIGRNISYKTGSSDGYSPFYRNTTLRAVKITDRVTEISANEFYGCTNLKNVSTGNGVTTIDDWAFSGCKSINFFSFGSSVESIGNYAFSGCSTFTTITIPQSTTSIGDFAFQDCRALKTVVMKDSADDNVLILGSNGSSPLFADCPLDSVYIGRNISYQTGSSYGYSPFYRNTTLRAVKITDRETEISANEFYGCTNLKNVSIGNGVTTIGDWAFSGCSSLDFFSFGSNVESIGKAAFSDCTAMTRLISHAEEPPTCGTQALNGINKWDCTLSVPTGKVAAYQQADQWKEFFFIYENAGQSQPELAGDINGDGTVNALDVQEVINAAVVESTDPVYDVNSDGLVNALDVQEVINKAAAAARQIELAL